MKIVKLSLFIVASLPLFIAIYGTLNNQIYGADSWYWLMVSKFPMWLFNLFPIALYGLIIALFYRADGSFENRILLLAIFLSNLFAARFLEFEMKDFLMYAIFFTIFSINPKKMVWLGIPIIFLYALLHGWLGINGITVSYPQFNGVYAETSTNHWFVFLIFLPTIFLFTLNSKWKFLITLIILIFIFPFGKVSNPLPFFILPAFLSMTGEKNVLDDKTGINPIIIKDKKIKFPKYLLLGFSIICFILIASETIREVKTNLIALEKCCDPTTKLCKNYNGEDWYFYYLGYTHEATGWHELKCNIIS